MGGTEKAVDLDLISPVTHRRLFVQVKSQSNRKRFEQYLASFETHAQYDEMFFIVHSPKGDISKWTDNCDSKKIKVLAAPEITKLAVNAGLIGWLIEKCS